MRQILVSGIVALGGVGALQDQASAAVGYDEPHVRRAVNLQCAVVSAGGIGSVGSVQIQVAALDVITVRPLGLDELPLCCLSSVGDALQASIVVRLAAGTAAVGVAFAGSGCQIVIIVRENVIRPIGDLIVGTV